MTAEDFVVRLKQANLATKADIVDFAEKTDFEDKLKNLNKKFTSNKTKHLEAEKKLTDLTNKVGQISEKGHNFLFGRMYFTGDDGFQNFLVFVPMPSSLIRDSNKEVTNCISTGILSQKIKPFDINLEPTMSGSVNGNLKI